MQNTITRLSAMFLAMLFPQLALAAAPAPKTQVLFSGVVSLTGTALNVAGCEQIRVTASIPKEGSDTVFLWDDSAPSSALLAAPVVIPLDGTKPYSSVLLETPGLTLTISGFGVATAIVYCR